MSPFCLMICHQLKTDAECSWLRTRSGNYTNLFGEDEQLKPHTHLTNKRGARDLAIAIANETYTAIHGRTAKP